MQSPAVPVSQSLDIVGTEAVRDPQGYFGRLRDASPVLWDTRSRSWVITGYREVAAALRDDAHFSSDRIRPFIDRKLNHDGVDPKIRRAFDLLTNWLVFNDKPAHLRLRMLVSHAFMSKALAALGPRVQALCDEILAAAPADGSVELLEQVAIPFSASVISEILGVPREDRGRFEQWHRLFGPVIGASLNDANKYESLGQGVEELIEYVRWLMARQKERPREDLLGELIAARESGDALSEEEIVATCTLILFAGSETTANQITNSMLALLRHPGEMAKLRSGAVDMSRATEEFLRFDGSGKAITRLARVDNEVLGVPMKAGQRVFLILAAANRDPAVYSNPDQLVLDRVMERKHIAFGYGIHTCLGSQLSRLEMSVALPRILARWKRVELAGELEWHPQLLSRGLKALPLSVSA